MSPSKNGKIAGIIVYKPKATTSKVTVEIRTYKVSIKVIKSKFSEILGRPSYHYLETGVWNQYGCHFIL